LNYAVVESPVVSGVSGRLTGRCILGRSTR